MFPLMDFRKIGTWSFVAAGSAVTIMASVKRDDVFSNISSYLPKEALDAIPFLASHQADKAVIGSVLLIAALVAFWWVITPPTPKGRISLIEFSKLALDRGWKLHTGGRLEALDLMDGLKEAAVDGDVLLSGRYGMGDLPENSKSQYPVRPIDPMHVATHRFNAKLYLDDMKNFNTRLDMLFKPSEIDVRDLHLEDAEKALRWLKTARLKWKGHHAAIEAQRDIDNARDAAEMKAYLAASEPQISDANSGQTLDKKDG